MQYCKVVCIIVDAYSTGKHLATIIKAQGYPCIHIRSTPSLPSRYQHREEDFILSLTFDANLEYILECLKPYQIKCCIPGYESGVELADLLCKNLCLPGNDSQYSAMKRDKYLMNQSVAKANLTTVKQCLSDDLSVLQNWVNTAHNYPVVAKPLSSANGDGIFFCDDAVQLRKAFEAISSSKNQFGILNKVVLVESLNVGDEYIVNTVSWNKKHLVAEIWRVVRVAHTTIYDKAEMLSVKDDLWETLVEYTQKVLDALHIEYGAATTEVKYTQEFGAVLLETSGRLMGNSPLAFSCDLRGFTQLSLLIEAYLNTDSFLQRCNQMGSDHQELCGMIVVLVSDSTGIISKSFADHFKKLKTLHSYNVEDTVGSKLCKTIDSLTSPGELYLLGSKEELERDYEEIRAMEQQLYHTVTSTLDTDFLTTPTTLLSEEGSLIE